MFVFKIYCKILEVFHNNKDQPMTAMDVVKKVYTVGSDLYSGVCICNLINFYTKNMKTQKLLLYRYCQSHFMLFVANPITCQAIN